MADHAKAGLSAWQDTLVQEMCEQNGISKDEFVHNRHQVDGIELFLTSLQTMKIVQWFTGLVKLQVMHQEITTIEGLDAMPNLEYLWLNENSIVRISGLNCCTKLKELYLYSNQIQRIENLHKLVNLEVLWLQDNCLTSLDGLGKLRSLKTLWVAQNNVTTIGGSLDNNVMLEEVNLAGNQIGSFREIPYLDRLPNLTTLYFSDPHFGDNPICQLCNYQTYTLYHLNRVKVLDYNTVSDANRQFAEATFVKKKMYYNMRIKTLRRNTSNLIKKASQFRQTKLSEVNLSLNVLVRMTKELEREIEEVQQLPPPQGQTEETQIDPIPLPELQTKLNAVSATAQRKFDELEEIDDRYGHMKNTIETISQDNLSKLLVELQTGGNIRMEEGKVSDVWYKSCMDLVRSRFFADDFEPFGVKDFRITKVTRIHNRYLRNRFEDRLDQLVDTSNQAYKKALEYLFYGEDPDLNGEMTTAIEGGFRPVNEYEAAGKDGGVALTNSVFLSEQNRLLRMVKQGILGQNLNPATRQDGIMGRLLITKVFLGKCCPERAGEKAETQYDDKPGFNPIITPADAPACSKIRRKDYASSVGSVYRTKPGEPKHRVWFSFDHEVILPEYLVEYMYVPTPSAFLSTRLSISTLIDYSTDDRLDELQDVINKLVPTKSDLDATDIRSYAHFFLAFIHQCSSIVSGDKELSCELLSSSPIPKQRAKVSAIDTDLIKKSCRTNELSEVKYLNLFGNHIRKVAHLEQCTALQTLVLSFNEIQRIEGIADLPHLTHLDLSFNLIKRVEGLANLPALDKLELNNNLIYRLEDVNVIKKTVPTITDLALQNNVICDVKSYKFIVLRRVPGLKVLDGKKLTAEDHKSAQEKLSSMSPALVASCTHTQPTSGWALSLQPNLGCDKDGKNVHWKEEVHKREEAARAEIENEGMTPNHKDTEANGANGAPEAQPAEYSSDEEERGTFHITRNEELVLSKAIEVNCPKMRVRRIENLDRCRELRRLNLSDNEIHRIEGLENCPKLEELYMDDNRIVKLEGLSLLINLRKLELGKNKISKIEGLECLPFLCQVSLEDNDLHSLQGIQKVPNLMELYIGNNKVDNLKEIHALRDIPKLIIVDLSGNPLCLEPDYRLYTIFNLKKLKVLDGISIDANESVKAKDNFAGKMSPELLTERVGKLTEWYTITDLNLSSCSIRELSLLEHFPSLLHLKCDHNLLSDLSGLKPCTTLLSLNLNSNRIGSDASKPGFVPLGKCIEQMTSLESLSLEANQITSISALALNLVNLRFLNLRSNEITRVDGLEMLPQLCELILDRNKLRGLDDRSFSGCQCLRDLHADENMIKSLDGLRHLPNLSRLFLSSNRISDLQELEKLEGLERITEACLSGNAVARKTLYRPTLVYKLPNCLVIDGRDVLADEREKADLFFNQEYYAYQHPPNVYTDRPATLSTQQPMGGAKGAVKLVSFEYHDAPTPAPIYHCQSDQSKIQSSAFSQRQRQSQAVVQTQASNHNHGARTNLLRTNSADGTNLRDYHTGGWPSSNTGARPGQVMRAQPKIGRQRPMGGK
eukprot:TRINITY_DN15672_c0_g1_i1.p1 TRINITY_DN15672_c0_g1~~TRINITY_DN15672_c0_g1_i1.p1  ORF type:complete len:1553 (+),score=713.90 TRINITY_DN15672_c0_g1_i1:108-4766(+)